MQRTTVFSGVILMTAIIGFIAVDALYIEKEYTENLIASLQEEQNPNAHQDNIQEPDATNGTVTKVREPDVLAEITKAGFTTETAREAPLLAKVIPESVADVDAYVLLVDGDRAGMVSWVTTPQVKRYFVALKEALAATFSPQVKDLVDETQKSEGRPTRNILTFLDTGISDERMVFVRIRERLYEIRVSEGHDKAMFTFIETLTQ